MARKVRILSLDGGGIRGILPGVILADLEDRLRRKAGAERRLADFFELIAGTSTGGILACGYLTPTETGRPKYTAHDMLDVYLNSGRRIFQTSFGHTLKSARGLIGEKYSANGLENTLAEYFKDARLSDLLKPCLITAYDIDRHQTTLFNKTDGASGARNLLLREVARATSAAPPYFSPSTIRWKSDERSTMIDGAVFANNPAMCAYSEARSMDFSVVLNNDALPCRPVAKDMIIVSIGTGGEKTGSRSDHVSHRGALGWILPLMEIMMSGIAETVHYQLKQIFETTGEKDNYVRLQPTRGKASPAMDNTRPRNLEALHAAGRAFVTANQPVMDDIADRLIASGESCP